jgi:hypothetical protein
MSRAGGSGIGRGLALPTFASGRVLLYFRFEGQTMWVADKKANPLDGSDRPQPQAAEQFSQLCESMKDAPPEEQASRVREHFGVFGGARPVGGRKRRALDRLEF